MSETPVFNSEISQRIVRSIRNLLRELNQGKGIRWSKFLQTGIKPPPLKKIKIK